MNGYEPYKTFFGDIHNHCGISYAHGSLEDALNNARERLDFVSVTGHAHWPDMPAPEPDTQYIIDFHEEGFAKLKSGWGKMMQTLKEFNKEGSFIVYPGFEVHFCATGDRNIFYKDLAGEILYPKDLDDLHDQLRGLREQGSDSIAQPHHVGYRKGTRGIDWDSFSDEFAPFVEMLSMHGCSESNDNTRPFLHSMGPSDYDSTILAGLQRGRVFGFSGGTDHHSAHPGSYGHGLTGIWAKDLSRESVWDAMLNRRMYALTGDRMDIQFALNDAAMGSVIPHSDRRDIQFDVRAGGAIDCVDILRDGILVKRFSQYEMDQAAIDNGDIIRTKVFVELGWGGRNKTTNWNVTLGINDGQVTAVEPRFRGQEVVAPSEADEVASYFNSRVCETTDRSVTLETVSAGNPNNSTPAMQGMCLHVEAPRGATVEANFNGTSVSIPLATLIQGARTGHLGNMDSAAWRFHRAPLEHQWHWAGHWSDDNRDDASYYIRVRQQNDQWAWTSPVFVRDHAD
tara:strand:- start:39071 stop:40603 length:1533 start_codon:yes stop_codon:yes gene_type:complete